MIEMFTEETKWGSDQYYRCEDIANEIQKFIDENKDNQKFYYYGLRFENKNRKVGSKISASRHNPDRSDERDFPEYGKSSYYRLPKLDGTSAWHIDMDGYSREWVRSFWSWSDKMHDTDGHCYIIASDERGYNEDPDPNETLIKNAIVVCKIY
jgi:hypothetical protein